MPPSTGSVFCGFVPNCFSASVFEVCELLCGELLFTPVTVEAVDTLELWTAAVLCDVRVVAAVAEDCTALSVWTGSSVTELCCVGCVSVGAVCAVTALSVGAVLPVCILPEAGAPVPFAASVSVVSSGPEASVPCDDVRVSVTVWLSGRTTGRSSI